MEEQLFPRAELEPAYEQAIWLYVYRDFSGDEADKAAERIMLRFGFSSYPQHHLLHPITWERLATPSRALEPFLKTFAATRLDPIETTDALGLLEKAEARAAKLEKKQSKKDALAALAQDTDVVVRYRAVEVLKAKAPKELSGRAKELLAVGNDPLRYLVLDVLKDLGDTDQAGVLEALVKDPKDSLNPNVLRIKAVQALGTCGAPRSIGVVAPHAAGPWNNGLTRISISTLAAIGSREREARDSAKEALLAAYPTPPAEGATEREQRAILSLAKHVHTQLGHLTKKQVRFPDDYDDASREKLRKAW
jgi:hypothetical protein